MNFLYYKYVLDNYQWIQPDLSHNTFLLLLSQTYSVLEVFHPTFPLHVFAYSGSWNAADHFSSTACKVGGLHPTCIHVLIPLRRNNQPFSSAYTLHTLRTFCVPPSYNFPNLHPPNIIICNLLTLEQLFAYPMGLYWDYFRYLWKQLDKNNSQ